MHLGFVTKTYIHTIASQTMIQKFYKHRESLKIGMGLLSLYAYNYDALPWYLILRFCYVY